MKNTASLAALAFAGMVSLAGNASALVYNDHDLILGIRAATGAVNDLEYSLGSASLFTAGATGGSTAPITFAGVSITDINAEFGSFNNVLWSVSGTVTLGDSLPGAALNTLWVTRTSPSTPWLAKGSAVQSQGGGKIVNIGGGMNSLAATALPNSLGTGVSLPDSTSVNSASYHAQVGALGNLAGTFQGSIETAIGANFTSTAGATSVADLYQLLGDAASNSKGTLLGSFQFGNDGTLTFVPVPEASTYGLFAGAGLLLLSVRQQFRRRTV